MNDTASSTSELLMLSPTEMLTHYLRGSPCSASNVQQWSQDIRLVALYFVGEIMSFSVFQLRPWTRTNVTEKAGGTSNV